MNWKKALGWSILMVIILGPVVVAMALAGWKVTLTVSAIIAALYGLIILSGNLIYGKHQKLI
jgi:hypothetical protein